MKRETADDDVDVVVAPLCEAVLPLVEDVVLAGFDNNSVPCFQVLAFMVPASHLAVQFTFEDAVPFLFSFPFVRAVFVCRGSPFLDSFRSFDDDVVLVPDGATTTVTGSVTTRVVSSPGNGMLSP